MVLLNGWEVDFRLDGDDDQSLRVGKVFIAYDNFHKKYLSHIVEIKTLQTFLAHNVKIISIYER